MGRGQEIRVTGRRAWTACALAFVVAGCSVREIAVDGLAGALASSGDVFASGDELVGGKIDCGRTLVSTRALLLLVVHWSSSVESITGKASSEQIFVNIIRSRGIFLQVLDVHGAASVPDSNGNMQGRLLQIDVNPEGYVQWDQLGRSDLWKALAIGRRKDVLGRLRGCHLADSLLRLRTSQRGAWLLAQLALQVAGAIEDMWMSVCAPMAAVEQDSREFRQNRTLQSGVQ